MNKQITLDLIKKFSKKYNNNSLNKIIEKIRIKYWINKTINISFKDNNKYLIFFITSTQKNKIALSTSSCLI